VVRLLLHGALHQVPAQLLRGDRLEGIGIIEEWGDQRNVVFAGLLESAGKQGGGERRQYHHPPPPHNTHTPAHLRRRYRNK
jgi:hypothetical protein